jgi:hypothetical protein
VFGAEQSEGPELLVAPAPSCRYGLATQLKTGGPGPAVARCGCVPGGQGRAAIAALAVTASDATMIKTNTANIAMRFITIHLLSSTLASGDESAMKSWRTSENSVWQSSHFGDSRNVANKVVINTAFE